jgi:hypothetical protein
VPPVVNPAFATPVKVSDEFFLILFVLISYRLWRLWKRTRPK